MRSLWFQVRDPFEAIDSSGDLGRAGRMGPFVVGSALTRFGLYAASSYLLTLLIAPEEFGRLLQVAVPVALVALFGDFGLGDGVVRLKEVDAKLSSLFLYLNLGFATVVATLLLLIIPAFEAWFDGVYLMDLGQVMAVNLVVTGVSSQYKALVRRQMRFKALSGIEVVTSVSSNLIPLGLAVSGVGVIAIPLGRLGASLAELVLMVMLTRWIPGIPARLSKARSTLDFGLKLAFSGVLHFGATAVSAMMIGRIFPEETLGFLERSIALSRGIVDRILSLFQRVSFPVLARSRHGDEGRFSVLSLGFFQILCVVTVVPSAAVAAVGNPLAPLLFGEQWAPMGSFLSLQWAALLFAFPGILLVNVMLAAGRSGLLVKVNAARLGIELLILGVTVIWLEDLHAYLVSRVVMECFLMVIISGLIGRMLNGRVWDYARPAIFALVCAVCTWALILGTMRVAGLGFACTVAAGIIILCGLIPVFDRRRIQAMIASDTTADMDHRGVGEER